MKIDRYVRGLLGLCGDVFFGVIRFLLHPLRVLVFVLAVFAVFFVCGVSPYRVGKVVSTKWNALVMNRKQVLEEEINRHIEKKGGQKISLDSVLSNIGKSDENRTVPANPDFYPVAPDADIVSQKKSEMYEQKFGWDKAMETADVGDYDETDGRLSVRGVLSVLDANRVKIGNRVFRLKGIRLTTGTVQKAYIVMRKEFNGMTADCRFIDETDTQADCYVERKNIIQPLLNFGYAVSEP